MCGSADLRSHLAAELLNLLVQGGQHCHNRVVAQHNECPEDDGHLGRCQVSGMHQRLHRKKFVTLMKAGDANHDHSASSQCRS